MTLSLLSATAQMIFSVFEAMLFPNKEFVVLKLYTRRLESAVAVTTVEKILHRCMLI